MKQEVWYLDYVTGKFSALERSTSLYYMNFMIYNFMIFWWLPSGGKFSEYFLFSILGYCPPGANLLRFFYSQFWGIALRGQIL